MVNPFARQFSQLWVGVQEIEFKKNTVTMVQQPLMPTGPVVMHALPEVPPWRGMREPYVFGGEGPWALCRRPMKAILPLQFDVDDEGELCEKCVALVRSGVTSRPPRRRGFDLCSDVLGLREGGAIACTLWHDHQGPHRDPEGATWTRGWDDYTPPPDGVV